MVTMMLAALGSSFNRARSPKKFAVELTEFPESRVTSLPSTFTET